MALRNFNNLMHYDLMTLMNGLYRFLLILLFWHCPYSLRWVIQWVKEFKNYSVETVSEVSHEKNVMHD